MVTHVTCFTIADFDKALTLPQASKQRDKAAGDFHEALVREEKGVVMDITMEDKICDLYDLYVQVYTKHAMYLHGLPY